MIEYAAIPSVYDRSEATAVRIDSRPNMCFYGCEACPHNNIRPACFLPAHHACTDSRCRSWHQCQAHACGMHDSHASHNTGANSWPVSCTGTVNHSPPLLRLYPSPPDRSPVNCLEQCCFCYFSICFGSISAHGGQLSVFVQHIMSIQAFHLPRNYRIGVQRL